LEFEFEILQIYFLKCSTSNCQKSGGMLLQVSLRLILLLECNFCFCFMCQYCWT